jgi:hypothetical protein
MVWRRKLFYARRPWLGRQVWHYRAAVAKRPALRPVWRRHAVFLARHPHLARAVVHHRKWVRHHHPPSKPHAVKPHHPKHKPPKPAKPKKPPPPPKRRR